MDDIRIDDDPRKQSARKLKNKVAEKPKRGFFGFLADWLVKSLLMTIVLAIDFTLFLNAGNYNIFTDYGDVNIEAMFIYAGIAAVSLIAVLLFMIILPLEDILLGAVFAVTGIAVINQFAIFDKKSGLLVLVGEWFSDDTNALLYQYFYWIVGGGIFLITFILLKLLRRSGRFYLMLLLGGLCAWLVSESYFNSNKLLFRQITAQPSKVSNSNGKNLVFLAFNNMTSINNLKNLNNEKLPIADIARRNALAFLTKNGFVTYPNAVIDRSNKPFQNLYDFYNLGDKEAHSASVVTQDGYFDFDLLHPETTYLDKSSLFSALKKQGYDINVYQISGTNVCRLEDGKLVSSCNEKVNYPIIMPADKVSMVDRLVILVSQWVVSTGLVEDINPVLEVARYAWDKLKPYDFKVDELNVINSFNVLDVIISDMKYKNGNQAYFAIVDFPSNTFVYDEYCSLKPVRKWVGEASKSLAQLKRQNYFEQTTCLYGQLNKFINQLKDNEMMANTSVILVGLNNPAFIGNSADKDFYHKIQMQQVELAIKPMNSDGYKFDYRLCTVGDLLNMHFLDKKTCKEFGFIKTTEKNVENIKKAMKANMFTNNAIISANEAFNKWFDVWADTNNYDSSRNVVQKNKVNNESKEIEAKEDLSADNTEEKGEISDNVPVTIEDNTLSDNQYEKTEEINLQEEAAEVIPSTLFDNGVNIEEKAGNNDEVVDEVIEEETPSESISLEEIKESETEDVEIPVIIEQPIQEIVQEVKKDDNPKLGYDLKQTIENAKAKAEQNIEQAKIKAAEDAKKFQQDAVVKREEQTKQAKEKISQQNDAIKSILVAPKTDGKKLSPEELKEQYHEMLRQAKLMSGNTISIEIVE